MGPKFEKSRGSLKQLLWGMWEGGFQQRPTHCPHSIQSPPFLKGGGLAVLIHEDRVKDVTAPQPHTYPLSILFSPQLRRALTLRLLRCVLGHFTRKTSCLSSVGEHVWSFRGQVSRSSVTSAGPATSACSMAPWCPPTPSHSR